MLLLLDLDDGLFVFYRAFVIFSFSFLNSWTCTFLCIIIIAMQSSVICSCSCTFQQRPPAKYVSSKLCIRGRIGSSISEPRFQFLDITKNRKSENLRSSFFFFVWRRRNEEVRDRTKKIKEKKHNIGTLSSWLQQMRRIHLLNP